MICSLIVKKTAKAAYLSKLMHETNTLPLLHLDYMAVDAI
jgi:hypothetical protein